MRVSSGCVSTRWRSFVALMERPTPPAEQWKTRMLRRVAVIGYSLIPAIVLVFYFVGIYRPDLVLAAAGLAVAGVPLMAFNKNPWELSGGVLGLLGSSVGIMIGDFSPGSPRDGMVIVVLAVAVSALAILVISVAHPTAITAERMTRRSDFRLTKAAGLRIFGLLARKSWLVARPFLIAVCLVFIGSLAGDSRGL
ncbi:hypothetical protein L2091_01630 [Curtobacterium albidum]|uniref:hypothetical protein n=1 Tax=Curtobacterium citreum TaxID=2036 RepID=UPI0020275CCC|nr:hypothetical protein [Curtobacterium albidum]MCL9663929.1 hypothetical protein [Curtobacterium albidum]